MSRGTAKIFRYSPEKGEKTYAEYGFEYDGHLTVLDVLSYIRDNCDSSLEFESCCRNEKCGQCAVTLDGREILACITPAKKEMTIGPLKGFPVIRDLRVDRTDAQNRLNALNLRGGETGDCFPPFVGADDLELYKEISGCIECMCCMSACPVWKNDEDFAGPLSMVLVFRQYLDLRDTADRTEQFRDMKTDKCINCGRCADVCPENIKVNTIIERVNKNT